MDSIKMEKIQAINKYNKCQLMNNFILCCLTAMTSIILCSSSSWLPSLISSIKAFLFVSIPNIGVLFFNPKSLFIVCNIIIVFLIGESKFGGSNSSPDTEIYDEYVKRSVSLHRQRTAEKEDQEVKSEMKMELELALVEECEKRVVVEEEKETEEEKGAIAGEGKMEEEIKNNEEEENQKEEEEEERGLPAEVLNRKVEDFIAKINNQRKLEARLLVCGRG